MTREEKIFIESLDYAQEIHDAYPSIDINDCAMDFRVGAQWSDENPNWIKTEDELPPEGIEVIAFHHKWIDEDFNPNGTRIGFLNGNDEFTSAYWWDYQDCYETINKSNCEDNEDFYRNHIDNTEPEYWCYLPKPPKI